MKKLRRVGIIPARFASPRFSGKLLANLAGRPVLEWVYRSAKKSKAFEKIIIAPDDPRILRAAANFGAEAVMTGFEHSSGTDRIADVARRINCDVVVNLQGDHPFVTPPMVRSLLAPFADKKVEVATLAYPERGEEKLKNPNSVKVVFDKNKLAMYFSRSIIRSEEHTSELQSRLHLVCRLLLETKDPYTTRILEEVNTQCCLALAA